MSELRLTQGEIRSLQEALGADFKTGDVRLREGEYQYDLAKAIASFLLELCFPDVKDLIKRSYGEDKANDIQFIRKVQTILKKMEKSNVVKILPKSKPWELQRYALSSFKFQDADKNQVILATDEQIKQAQNLLQSMLNNQGAVFARTSSLKIRIGALVFIVVASYGAILWALTLPLINPLIFIPAFCVAVASALMLGKSLSKE